MLKYLATDGLNKRIAFLLAILVSGFSFAIASYGLDCNPRDWLQSHFISQHPDSIGKTLSFETHTLPLRGMGEEVLKAAELETPITYFVDTHNQLYFNIGPRNFPNSGDGFLLIKDTKPEVGHIVKEWGIFRYDSSKKRYFFDKREGFGLEHVDLDQLAAQAKKDVPEIQFQKNPAPAKDYSQTLKCLDLMTQQKKGKNFVLDSLIASNTVTIAGIVTSDLVFGSNLIRDPKNWPLTFTDILTTNIGTAITSPLVKNMLLREAGPVQDFTVRTGSDYLVNQYVKRPLYDANVPLSEKEKEQKTTLGEKLVPYDTGFAVLRFIPKRGLDQALLTKVPQMLISHCLRGNELMAEITPRYIRIADRFAWSLIYLSGRGVYLKSQTPAEAEPEPGSKQ